MSDKVQAFLKKHRIIGEAELNQEANELAEISTVLKLIPFDGNKPFDGTARWS